MAKIDTWTRPVHPYSRSDGSFPDLSGRDTGRGGHSATVTILIPTTTDTVGWSLQITVCQRQLQSAVMYHTTHTCTALFHGAARGSRHPETGGWGSRLPRHQLLPKSSRGGVLACKATDQVRSLSHRCRRLLFQPRLPPPPKHKHKHTHACIHTYIHTHNNT